MNSCECHLGHVFSLGLGMLAQTYPYQTHMGNKKVLQFPTRGLQSGPSFWEVEETDSKTFVPAPFGHLGMFRYVLGQNLLLRSNHLASALPRHNNSPAQDSAHEMVARAGTQRPDSEKEQVLGAGWDSSGCETDEFRNS